MRRIELSGKHAVGVHRFAVVDDDDYADISQYKWKAKPNGNGNNVYAVRNAVVNGRAVTVRMHRAVLGYDGPLDVDHINHNALDNRKLNLRLVTRSENMRNARQGAVLKCVRCGAAYRPEKATANGCSKFCSDQCRHQSDRDRAKQASIARRSLVCSHCGVMFVGAHVQQLFCSESCRKKAKWKRQKEAQALPPSASRYFQAPCITGNRDLGLSLVTSLY